MGKVSYHTHTTVSDGKLSPEELIKLAIERGFEVLAITDHYKRTSDVGDWARNFYSDEDYKKMVKLKKKYSDKIQVLVGAEFDWLPTKKNWLEKEITKRPYDIKILSVHLLYINEKYYSINGDLARFEETLKALGGDIKKLVKLYYKNLRDGISTGWFDSIGHLDVIKVFNKNYKYFSEKEDWYKKEVLKTLKLAKKFDMKLDLNLQGLIFEIGEQFPSKWIINEAKKMGIEFLIGTDSHWAESLDYDEKLMEGLLNGKY